MYALSAALRDAIATDGHATLEVSLRPDLPAPTCSAGLKRHGANNHWRHICARRRHCRLLRSDFFMRSRPGKLAAMDAATLACLIQALPLRLTGTLPIERAISTAGGVCFSEMDDGFMLRRRPGTFVAGEMLDWEAPTGGYLLQACFATGVSAAAGALRWLEDQSGSLERARLSGISCVWEQPGPSAPRLVRSASVA